LGFGEICFASPDGFFRTLVFGDVDHRPYHFTQVPACVDDRMTRGPDIPDSRDGMNDTHVHFEIRLVANGSVELLSHRGPIVRMDPLKNCCE
jgi:hypothetical protein